MVALLLPLSACVNVPTGKEKVALIDQLVAEQEFARIQRLLSNIDTEDPEFESLVVRRRAIRPLISQFEQYTVERVQSLQAQDLWPQALAVLEDAQQKIPDSEKLKQAEKDFFVQRTARLETIQQQIELLEGQNQADKSPLVEQIVAIHPTGISSRWQHFQHERKSKALAENLMGCGTQALAQQQLDLAEACFSMVRALSVGIDVSSHLALIQEERLSIKQQAEVIAKVEAKQKRQQRADKVFELKEQYRHLAAAGWLVAAKHALVELRLLVPDDMEARQWAIDLQSTIDQQVAQGISQGQALYSHGKLEEALITWQSAAQLDPENPILQGHIARAERFIQKLERLNNDKS